MKKIIPGFIIAAILFTGITEGAIQRLNVVPNKFQILINGQPANVEAYNINGSTFLKLTDLTELFRITTKFNSEKNTIEINANTAAIKTPTIEKPQEQPITSENPSDQQSKTYEKDGVTITKIDGIEHISEDEFIKQHAKDNYVWISDFIGYKKPAPPNSKTGDIEAFSNIEIIIENMPIKRHGAFKYIEYEFYKEKILPLLE